MLTQKDDHMPQGDPPQPSSGKPRADSLEHPYRPTFPSYIDSHNELVRIHLPSEVLNSWSHPQVVDEGHRLKSSESKLSKALHDLRTEHRILLTGTPLQNNLDELFMLMHFLDATKVGGLISQLLFCAKNLHELFTI